MKNNRFKKSIDFEESSVRLIELYKQEKEKIYKTKIAYSYIINELINKFIFMNRDVKLALLNTCKEELEKLNKEVIDINSYSGIKKDEIKKQYIELINFFADEEVLEVGDLRKIEIVNGYVQFPKEWIVLNEGMAVRSKYVGVIEATISTELVYRFIYFYNKPIDYMKNTEREELEEDCFKEIEEKKIEKFEHYKIPDYDKDNIYYPFGAVVIRNN